MSESTANHGSPPPTDSVDNASSTPGAEHVAFVLVPVFFVLGLLGVLICHVLKSKGYRCTTEAEEQEEQERLNREKDPEAADQNDTLNDNDTVNQIVRCIMKNEANSDALNAMVHENSIDSDGPTTPTSPISPTSPSPPVTPVSPGAPAGAAKHTCSHLHTIGGMGGHKNICGRCNQKKWPLIRQGSKGRGDRRSQVGEVTVLAVGRFRVTKCEPKPAKERTLLITETNGVTPPSDAQTGPPSGATSERQEENNSAK